MAFYTTFWKVNKIDAQFGILPFYFKAKKKLVASKRINIKKNLKVNPIYDPYVGECLLERTLVLGHRHCEIGWPDPFLAAFISSVFPPGTHLQLGGQWASSQPMVPGGSRTAVWGTVGKHSNRYATRPWINNIEEKNIINYRSLCGTFEESKK